MPEARFTIHVLGTLRVTSPSGKDVTPRSRKARALLGYLALSPDHSADRRIASGLLWSDRGNYQAAASLRQAVWELATALEAEGGTLVASTRRHVALVPDQCRIDLLDLDAADPDKLGELLVDLDRCDVSFDEWLARERAARRPAIFAQLRDRIERATSTAEVVAWSRALSRLTPVDAQTHAPPAPRLSAGALTAPPLRVIVASARAGAGENAAGDAVVRALTRSMARVRSLHLVPSTNDVGARTAYTVSVAVDARSEGPRIWVELVDERAQRVSWTESFDSAGLDDHEVLELTAKLEWHIRLAERRRAEALDEMLLDADGLIHRALFAAQPMTTSDLATAERLLARAVDVDPRSARAHAYYAFTQLQRAVKPANDAAGLREGATFHARRATELAPDDGWAWAVRGHVESFLLRNMDAARPCLDRALGLDPSSGLSWTFSAAHRSYVGDADGALVDARRSMQLTSSAESPFPSAVGQIGASVCAVAGDYGTAVRLANEVLATTPHLIGGYVPLLVSLGHLRLGAEAERQRARLRQLLPDLCIESLAERYPLVRRNPAFAQGLAQAGIA